MPRNLAAAISAAYALDDGAGVFLLEVELDVTPGDGAATFRLSTGTFDLVALGQTWQAVGGAMSFDTIGESTDLAAASTSVTVAGVNSDVLPRLSTAFYQNRSVSIYAVEWDPVTGALIDEPQLYRQGYLNGGAEINSPGSPANFEEGDVEVRFTFRSRLAGLDKVAGIRTNPGSHQRFSPGDQFFDDSWAAVNLQVAWVLD